MKRKQINERKRKEETQMKIKKLNLTRKEVDAIEDRKGKNEKRKGRRNEVKKKELSRKLLM